ncbi:MAG: hypothetical protein COA73_13175 [Candidatus Hydrogenedentota bacterium]|nr:MAG: hypothetical protein COA73_13175 [Candidatus Hydrogenedentota bacterium]
MKFTTLSRKLIAASLILLAPGYAAIAQQDSETSASDALEETNDALVKARARGGDLVTLTTGAIMSNVQVLRDTPHGYEIQVLEGMAPILIPRKMVVSIEYDDIDPLHEKRKSEMFGKGDDTLASGQQLAPELMERLRKPVPGDPIALVDTDLIKIVNQIATRSEVTIAIHPSIENIAPQDRIWSITTNPELTLMQLLEKQLLTKFPTFTIKYELNKLTLITKDALAKETPPEEPLAP